VLPETKYLWLGQSRIAYQVIGEGPPDLVVTNGSLTHVDIMWDDPAIALMFRRFSSFSRLIRFDRLGTGASDPAPLDHLPPWESYAEELAAVLDEVGSERTAILVSNDAASMALYFAGAHPQRTSALILFNSAAKYIATEDYPIGMPREAAEAFLDQLDQLWGTEALTRLLIPSRADDERFCRWHAKLLRSTASPKAAQAFLRVMFEIDARPLLPTDPRADVGSAPHRRLPPSDRVRPLPCRTHRRREAGRAARHRHPASLGRRHRTGPR
jgi:pimeloyl-ACP methyl ester carboxylesterase